MRKKILHIVGSLNQTKQLHKIALEMPDYDHYFTQFFGEGIFFKWLSESGLSDWNIMGTRSSFRQEQRVFLEQVNAKYDYRGETHKEEYALVFICSDMMVPAGFPNARIIFVQEGMTDALTLRSRWVNRLGLPGWMAGNTSLNGCSNNCDLYCVASPGYADYFAMMGTDRSKIKITGIPNFDHAASLVENDFPYQGYLLVCTSDIREVGGREDRISFIKKCQSIAANRQIIFRLHPNENATRAEREIRSVFHDQAMILQSGNTDHMIANCDELVTQYSSVVYIGMALGKKVHSYFPMALLKERLPVQNGGSSARIIAELVRSTFLEEDLEFFPVFRTGQLPQWAFHD